MGFSDHSVLDFGHTSAAANRMRHQPGIIHVKGIVRIAVGLASRDSSWYRKEHQVIGNETVV